MTRPRQGEIEGVDLASFQVGVTYDVGATLAAYLIATESADPVVDETPVEPSTFSHERLTGFLEKVRAVAADLGRPVDEPTEGDNILRAERRTKPRFRKNPADDSE